jgi:hypothetical protein
MGRGIPRTANPGGHSRPRSECHVLVIDDNMDAADTVGMFLESEGFPVVVGYSARTRFARWAQGPSTWRSWTSGCRT